MARKQEKTSWMLFCYNKKDCSPTTRQHYRYATRSEIKKLIKELHETYDTVSVYKFDVNLSEIEV